MKVFVFGLSETGKTTFSREFCKNLGFQHVQGSEWIKTLYKNLDPLVSGYRKEITECSIIELKKNPLACVDFIKRKYDLSKSTVVEGLRNPHDFHHLFDWKTDYVIFLDTSKTKILSGLDLGVDIIDRSVQLLIKTGILDKSRRFFEFFSGDSLFRLATEAGRLYKITESNELYRTQ